MDPRANQKRRSPWQEGGDSHSKFRAKKSSRFKQFHLSNILKILSTLLIPCSVGCDMGSANLLTKLCTTNQSKTGSSSRSKLLPTLRPRPNHRCSLSLTSCTLSLAESGPDSCPLSPQSC